MKELKKNNKAITLIALIITIVVMLILAGVTINLTLGENGIFRTAQKASEEHTKAQLKEEIEMAILEIQTEEVIKGNELTLQTLVEQLPTKLDITANVENNEITGEYKGYNYVIDSDFKVTIEGKITGITLKYSISPKEYTNNNVIITITATSTNGEITNIQAPDGLTKNNDGTYTATVNGEYEFTVTDSAGATKSKTVKIENIDIVNPTISIEISEITQSGFTITSNASDTESGIARYEYFTKIATATEYTKHETSDSKYEIKGLEPGGEYDVYVIVYDKANNSAESEHVTCTVLDNRLEYPILTLKGVMNAIDENGNYYYDSNISCSGPTTGGTGVLAGNAYDRDYGTYENCGSPSR